MGKLREAGVGKAWRSGGLNSVLTVGAGGCKSVETRMASGCEVVRYVARVAVGWEWFEGGCDFMEGVGRTCGEISDHVVRGEF